LDCERLSARFFSHPLTTVALRKSGRQTTQFVVLVHRYVIIDDPTIVLQNRGYITLRVAPVPFESYENVDTIFSDRPAAENTKRGWSCCIIWPREQTFLKPRCCGLVCVGAKNLVIATVIVFVTVFEAIELLSKSVAMIAVNPLKIAFT